MNVTCPAVASIPCSSSSPCNKNARQSSSANVGLLYSPLHRSSSGGCALSFTATSFNPSFFQLSYRRRKHNSSTKVLVVRPRSSTFDLDEEREGDGIQLIGSAQKRSGRGREEPASRATVSWSAENKARVSWAPQQQQDRALWSPEKQQSRDFWSSGSRNAHSGSSSCHSSSLNNQQRPFSSSQTLPPGPDFLRKPQTRVIDSTAASRLQNRLPAFKQAAEPDAFGASFFSVDGADAFSSVNPSNTHRTRGEEDGFQNGSAFTSKLEEILNKFKTREGGLKGSSSRDPYEERRRNEATPSAAQSATITAGNRFQATRNNAQAPNAWKPPRKDIQHPGKRGFAHETSVADDDFVKDINFSTTSSEGCQRDPHGERRLVMGRGSAGGFHRTESVSVNVSASSPPVPWKGDGESSPASKKRSHVRNGTSDLAGEKFSGRGKRTVSLSTSKADQKLYAQKFVVDKFDQTELDEEGNVDTRSFITSDSEDDGIMSSPRERADQPTSGFSMGVRTGRHEPIKQGQIAQWHSHSIPSLPFEFQYSYSETPKARVIRYREEPYSPFGPDTMERPWTGGPPLKKSKKNLPVFDSFNPPPKGKKGVKPVQDPGPYQEGKGPRPARSREEVLGEPLTGEEIVQLVDKCRSEKRLLNLGRDGLTHNMLDLVHCHWKRRRVIKVRCLGVPTVDMDNVCFHLEDKTGGKIIYRTGGIVYLFRGRNYNYKDRPVIPLMLWKPLAPVYPKLIKRAPEGLTKEEADKLRLLGQKVEPLCSLGKNGVYLNLVNYVRVAFKVDELVRIDCRGLNPSDYKKIGAKLRDLVPCVLLSFDDEQILMWRGRASVSADVGNSNSREAAEGSDFEAAKPSVSCDVGSADLSMVNTKTKALAVDAMADGADDESCSAIEDIKQQSSVVDTTGISMEKSECSLSAYRAEGSPGQASLGRSEVFGSHTAASPSWSTNDEDKNISLTNNGISTSSYSSGECHASTTLTGTTNEISSPEELRESGFTARSEVNCSMQSENNTRIDFVSGHEGESDAAQLRESRQFLESNLMEEDKEDEGMVPKPDIILDQPLAEVDNSKGAGAGQDGLNRAHVIVRVDDLWDDAIASGIAMQLDELDTDNDMIVKKASELAKTAPAGAEYTKSLLTKLRVRTEKIPRPDDDLRIHFRNLQKLKNEKKLSKRGFRGHKTVVPDKGGLPIEELARLLSIK